MKTRAFSLPPINGRGDRHIDVCGQAAAFSLGQF